MRCFEYFDSHPRDEPTTIRIRLLDFSPETRPVHSPAVRWRHVNHWSSTLLCLSAGLAGLQAAEPSADEFYRRDTVQTIHLNISKRNLQKMHDALPERIYVPGTFRWGDVKLKNVGGNEGGGW